MVLTPLGRGHRGRGDTLMLASSGYRLASPRTAWVTIPLATRWQHTGRMLRVPTIPQGLSPSQHFLDKGRGKPRLIAGASPWSLRGPPLPKPPDCCLLLLHTASVTKVYKHSVVSVDRNTG